MDSREMAKLVCKALDEKKAIDVKAIDISEVSVSIFVQMFYSDYT